MESRRKLLEPFIRESAYINSRVNAGIEAHRKGEAELIVVDGEGRPAPGAHVSARQKTHDFLCGGNLFLLDEIDDADKNRRCKELFGEAFNQATLPFYWRDIEPKKGELRFAADSPRIYRRPPPDRCLAWCEANGVTPKAHCLNYYNETPDWVPADRYGFWEALERRLELLAQRYAERIRCWEVTNETLCFNAGMAKPKKYFRPENSQFYDPELVERSFKLAERYFPRNELVINEAHFNVWGDRFLENRSAYYMQIERALLKGARIDAIGMQFHMFFPRENEARDAALYYDPYVVFGVLDRYADFHLPMQITEVTIPAYSNEPEDEEVQAELLRQLYRIWFSCPNMETVTYWNLADGYAWSEDNVPGNMSSGENVYYGGLLRFDGTPKPAYDAIRGLFGKEWRTNEELTADSDGHARLRGFFGEYELTVTAGGRTFKTDIHLRKDGAAPVRVVISG